MSDETSPSDGSAPLHVRRPELYRELMAVTHTTISSPAGNRYVAKTSDGEVIADIQEKRQAVSVSTQRNGAVDRITRTYADGTTEMVELQGGKVVVNTVGCPCTQESLIQNRIDSCYGRFGLVSALAFKNMTRSSSMGLQTYEACIVCSLEQKYHNCDGSMIAKPEDEFTPKSHMSCGRTQGGLEKYTKFVPTVPIFCPARHPETNELLCIICKYPILAHPPGVDASDKAYDKQGMGDFMYVMSGGRDGVPPVKGKYSEQLSTFMASQFGKSIESVIEGNARKHRPPEGWLPEHGKDTTIARRAAAEGGAVPRGPYPLTRMVTMPHTGWLEKFSTGRSLINNWKRRWFRVFGGMMHYYDKVGDMMHKGMITLSSMTDLYPNPNTEDHPEATTPDRDFLIVFKDAMKFGKQFKLLMRAPTAEEKQKWIDVLTS